MMSKKTRRDGNGGIEGGQEKDEGGVAEYEQSRELRIKQNLEKMQKLGILELFRNLKPPPKPKIIRPHKSLPSSSGSPRRSFRLKTMPTVNYAKKHTPKVKLIMNVKPEVYTEDHEKMLGDHKETWTLALNGFDGDRNPIDYAFKRKRCHQCRRKIAGIHSECCKCNTVQRLFCGSCLFKRYGENVLEANANPDWVCPVCRDICNCSYCRRAKGWEPIGNFYKKALQLGFKSVAHYLVHTRGPHGKQENIADMNDDDNRKNVPNIKNYDHDQQCKGDNNDENYSSEDN